MSAAAHEITKRLGLYVETGLLHLQVCTKRWGRWARCPKRCENHVAQGSSRHVAQGFSRRVAQGFSPARHAISEDGPLEPFSIRCRAGLPPSLKRRRIAEALAEAGQ